MTAPNVRIIGYDECVRTMREVDRRVQENVLRRGVRKSCQRLVQRIKAAMKSQLINRTRLLQKSIGYKVSIKRLGKARVVGVVGPRRGFKTKIMRTPRGVRALRKRELAHAEKLGIGRVYDPVRVAHLVDRGHGGPRPAPAYPYFAWTIEASREEINTTLRAEATTGIRAAI